VITDVCDGNLAAKLGVNKSAKLANAANTGAVEKVSIVNGVINFPASVDFSPTRQAAAGPTGLPPSVAQPGAIGQTGYSPIIPLPNGVMNAPQIARDQNGGRVITLGSESADKFVSLDIVAGTITHREPPGFQGGKPVLYASFDSSNPVAAAIEDVTYTPAPDAAPTVGDDSTASAGASLAAFTNGQTGVTNRNARPELGPRRRALTAERAALESNPGSLQPAVGHAPGPVDQPGHQRRPEPPPDRLRHRPEASPGRSHHRS
jgi:hypothetical protein